MKSLKKFTCICLSAAVFAAPLASAPLTAHAAAPKLSKSSAVLTVGKKMTLKVKNVKKGTAVKWSSTKKTVASVSAKGVVTAKSEGKATIRAVVNKKTLNCKVTVNEEASSNTDVNTDANPDQTADPDAAGEAPADRKDISALLAGRTYKGTATTPAGDIEVMGITFHSNGTATGARVNEKTMIAEQFGGTYQVVLKDQTAVITVEADGKTMTEELTVESEDFTKFSAKKNIMGMDITITVTEVKEG